MKKTVALFIAVLVSTMLSVTHNAQAKVKSEKAVPVSQREYIAHSSTLDEMNDLKVTVLPLEDSANRMTPEEKAELENMARAGAPGENHQFFLSLEGSWRAIVKTWSSSEANPEVWEGVSDNEVIFGGRYLLQTFKGRYMGQTFRGTGLLGYNNILGRYEHIWADNMSTSMTRCEASLSDDGMALNGISKSSDIRTEKEVVSRHSLVIINADQFVSQIYSTGPDGKEYLSMEITYLRIKYSPTR